mgnify:CR=1 FL=1
MIRARWTSAFALMSAVLIGPLAMLPAQTTRDSAGRRIVASDKPMWTAAQQLRLAAAPTLVIGDREEEPYQLGQVSGAFYLSDGRIVIGDGASNELRVFDGTGKHQNTFGRRGDGPGEFRRIQAVSRLAGDTIAVMHEMASVSRFTTDGAYITRTDEQNAGAPRAGGAMQSVALAFNGGARLVVHFPRRPSTRGVGVEFDVTGLHEVVGRNVATSRAMGNLPAMRASADKNGPSKPWLGAEEVFASDGAQFYLGYGTEYSLTRYTAAGVPNLVVRRAWIAPKVSRREFEEFTDEWLNRWSKATGAALEAERREQLAMAYFKTLPAFSPLLLDRLGRLWARAPAAIDGAVAGSLNDYAIRPSTWSVFSANGAWLGDVAMPARFTPTDIGADYVLGVARDDDAVSTVVRFRLGTR